MVLGDADPVGDDHEVQVLEEFGLIRALLEQRLPEFVTERTPVCLKTCNARFVPVVWKTLGGHAPILGLPSPAEAVTKKQVERMIRSLARQGMKIKRSDLPSPHHLVDVIVDPPATILFTDESAGRPDPPVLALGDESEGIAAFGESYLRFLADALCRRALERARFLPVSFLGSKLAGQSNLPLLAPHFARLADGFWADSSNGPPESDRAALLFDAVAPVARWMREQRIERLGTSLSQGAPFGMRAVLRSDLADSKALTEGLSAIEVIDTDHGGQETGGRHCFGEREGRAVWLYRPGPGNANKQALWIVEEADLEWWRTMLATACRTDSER